MWAPMCAKSRDAFGLVGDPQSCLSSVMIVMYASLAIIDFLIATAAGIQVIFYPYLMVIVVDDSFWLSYQLILCLRACN